MLTKKKLTWKNEKGEWGLDGVDLATLPPAAYGAIAKLKDIEHPVCPTNGDVIRNKTDEELVQLSFCPYEQAGKPMPCWERFGEVSIEDCDKCALNFLQSPAGV